MNKQHIQLRKYPNRRYYDVTRSQHVTLETIHRLILDGHDVTVTDSATGDDITGKVLAQIIFERDPPKLAVFPAALWHQVIRAGSPLVREFVEKYFIEALGEFLRSQRQFEDCFRNVLGLPDPSAAVDAWARMMLGPFAQPFFANPAPWTVPDSECGQSGRPIERAELETHLDALQRRIDALREELGRC